MPQVRAIAAHRLQQRAMSPARAASFAGAAPRLSSADMAQRTAITAEVKRFLDRPSAPVARFAIPEAPPGAPIGEPAMEWLRAIELQCTWKTLWEW